MAECSATHRHEGGGGREGKGAWTDYNRASPAVVAISGQGANTFLMVLASGAMTAFPVKETNEDGTTVDMLVPPKPTSITRETLLAHWGEVGALSPRTDIPLLGNLFRLRYRLSWALGISTSTISEEDVSGADDSRKYFLGCAYNVNQYTAVLLGVTFDGRLAGGFAIDLGTLKITK